MIISLALWVLPWAICGATTVFVSRDGSDFPLCGSETAPCGTLYQASVLVNAFDPNSTDVAVITVIDGQNETEISRHLSAADTNGFDPCLPVPFSIEVEVSIVFEPLLVTSMLTWYPLAVCPSTNTMYGNEYLFEGGKTLSVSNLILSDYTITDDSYYPIMKGSYEYFNTSVACYDCVFERIVSSVTDLEKVLIYGRVSVELRNNRWTDVTCSTSLVWVNAGFTGLTVNYKLGYRIVAITDSVFTNIDAFDYMVAVTATDSEPRINISDCTFTAMQSGVSLFRSDNRRDEMSITRSTFDMQSGSLCLFFHIGPSNIYFDDVTISSSQRWAGSGAEYGLIRVGTDDELTLTNTLFLYPYNMTSECELYAPYSNLSNARQAWREYTCASAYRAIENEGVVNMRNCELRMILTAEPVYDLAGANHEWEKEFDGQMTLFLNYGVWNVENLHVRRGLNRYLFRNYGTMTVYNFSTWYDAAEYNPNSLWPAVFTNWGGTASLSLDESRIIGFKKWAVLSYSASLYITNTVFELGACAVICAAGTVNLINNTFSRVGGEYFGQLFIPVMRATGITVPIYLAQQSSKTVLENNHISGFDPFGLIYLQAVGKTHVVNNVFTLNTSGTVYDLPEDDAMWADGWAAITVDRSTGVTEVINNVFVSDDIHYDPSRHWVIYKGSSGYHGVCGNTFMNAAIKVQESNVTSCFRPNLIKCIDIGYGECEHHVYGDMNTSLKDVAQEIVVTADIDSVFDIVSGNLALDRLHLLVSTTAADIDDPVIFKAVNASVLLVDSHIFDGFDISYYSNECEIAYNMRLRNASEYIAKLQLECGDTDSSAALQQTAESGAWQWVDSLSVVSIDVQSLSSTYYPGELLKISYTVMDELGNAIDYQATDNLVIRLEGDAYAFLTELEVLPSGVCSQCEHGVLINLLQVSEHIGDTFKLQVSILNDVLMSLNNEITLNITGCPPGYGPDEHNASCIQCNNGYFNLLSRSVDECQSCDPDSNTGVDCADGDIVVDYDHWIGFDDHDNASMISAFCPSRYCCQDMLGCKYNDPFNHVDGVMCAKNRDSSSKLCGACADGYSESMNSAKCVQCKRSFHFEFLLLPLVWSVILTLLIFFFSTDSVKQNSKKAEADKKEVVAPKNMCDALFKSRHFQFMIRTMVMKNIFYYQQAVTQILTTSTYQVLFRDLAAQFELSMTSIVFNDADEDSLWCFADGLGAKGKILIDLLIPAFVFVMVTIVFVVSRYVLKRPLGCCSKNQRINFSKAYITTYLIVIGKVLDILFKIMSCQQVGDEYVHYYFGYETCYQVSWWAAFISMLIIVAVFTLIFVHIKGTDPVERHSRSNPLNRFVSRYQPAYWYWEYVLFIRRIVIALFAVSVQNITAKFFFSGILIIFVFIQHEHSPFAVQESNQMEFILLCSLVFIVLTKISPIFNSVAVNVVVSFLIIAPFLLLVYYARQIYKTKISRTSGTENNDEPVTSVMSSSGDVSADWTAGIKRLGSSSQLDVGIELETTTNHRSTAMASSSTAAAGNQDNEDEQP